MAAGVHIVEDGKWYKLKEAQKREKKLQSSLPTGQGWYWVDKKGNQVIFGGKS
jgi:hypothetical protein